MTTVKRGGARARRVPMVDIGDGVSIPVEVGATSTTAEYVATITAVYAPQSGRYVTRRLAIEAAGDQEVTGDMLRRIPVKPLIRLATESAVLPYVERFPAELAKAGPTTDTLQQVALIYKLAMLLGDAPTQTVAERLDVPRSTAGRWVTRARDRGFLTVVDPRASRVER